MTEAEARALVLGGESEFDAETRRWMASAPWGRTVYGWNVEGDRHGVRHHIDMDPVVPRGSLYVVRARLADGARLPSVWVDPEPFVGARRPA